MPGSVTAAAEETELITATPASPISITLPDILATVVVTLTMDSKCDYFYGRGQHNPSAVDTYKETFFSGPCYGSGTLIAKMSFLNAAWDLAAWDDYQWYVRAANENSTRPIR